MPCAFSSSATRVPRRTTECSASPVRSGSELSYSHPGSDVYASDVCVWTMSTFGPSALAVSAEGRVSSAALSAV